MKKPLKRRIQQKPKAQKKRPVKSNQKPENSENLLKKFWRWGITFMLLFVFSLNFLCVEASCQEIQLDYYNMQFLDTSPNFQSKVYSYYSDGSVRFKKGILESIPDNNECYILPPRNRVDLNRDSVCLETHFPDTALYEDCRGIFKFVEIILEAEISHKSGEKSKIICRLHSSINYSIPAHGDYYNYFSYGYSYYFQDQYKHGETSIPFSYRLKDNSTNPDLRPIYASGQDITMRVLIGYVKVNSGSQTTLCPAFSMDLFKNDEIIQGSSTFFWYTTSEFNKITKFSSSMVYHKYLSKDDEGFPYRFRYASVNQELNAIKEIPLIYKTKPRKITLPPEAPDENVEDRPYWTYISNQLVEDDEETIFLEENISENQTINYSVDFSKLKVQSNERRYFYDPNTIKKDTLEDWNTYMFGYTVSWNFLRDGIIAIVNLTLLAGQFVMYILTLALNTLFIWLILWIIVLVWNFPVYWVFYGVVGIIFYAIFALTWLWEIMISPALNWVWEYLKLAWEWFMPHGLIFMIDFYLAIVSYVLAAVLFCVSFGRVSYDILREMVYSLLTTLNHGIFEVIFVFIDNFLLFIGFSLTYIYLFGMAYVMYVYVKARGYVNSAYRLESIMNVYKLPFTIAVRLGAYIVGFINGGVPTDGNDR